MKSAFPAKQSAPARAAASSAASASSPTLAATPPDAFRSASDFRLAGDWFFYAHVLAHGQIAYDRRSLNCHREHPGTVTQTTNPSEHYREILAVQDEIATLVDLPLKTQKNIASHRAELRKKWRLPDENLPVIFRNPLVSVVVPVYNLENCVETCLNSLLAQEYQNFELILVDDGSTDGSLKILRTFAEKHQKIKILHQKNTGLSAARNAGLKAASGEFIAFVDGDDSVDPFYLFSLLSAMRDTSDIAVCGYREVITPQRKNSSAEPSSTSPAGRSQDSTPGATVKKVQKCPKITLSGPDAAARLLVRQENYDLVAWNKLYRTSLFRQNDIAYPEGRLYEDCLTTYKLYAAAREVVVVPEPYCNYIRRAGSITSENSLLESLAARERAARESIAYFSAVESPQAVSATKNLQAPAVKKSQTTSATEASVKSPQNASAKLSTDSAPRVSVAVPNYNYAHYLPARVESILSQTFPIYELLILDDASTDDSLAVIDQIIRDHPAAPIRVLKNAKNSGNVFKQWARAFAEARGDYLWIAEADDLSRPDFLSAAMQGFAKTDSSSRLAATQDLTKANSPDARNPQKTTDVVLSYTESSLIDAKGREKLPDLRSWSGYKTHHHWNRSYVNPGPAELSRYLAVNNTIINVSAVVFKLDPRIPFQEYLIGQQSSANILISSTVDLQNRPVAQLKSLRTTSASLRTTSASLQTTSASPQLPPASRKKLLSAASVSLLTAKFAYLDAALAGRIPKKYGHAALVWIKNHAPDYENNPALTRRLRAYLKLISTRDARLYFRFRGASL